MSLSKKLENMSVTHPSPAEVLTAIPTKELIAIYRHESGDKADKIKKAKAEKKLLQVIEFTAVRYLTEDLPKKTLQGLLENLDIDHKASGNNPNSRRVLYKRALENMSADGIQKFLEENVEAELLEELVETLNVNPKSKKKSDLVKQVTNEALYAGLVAFFESLPLSTLHDVTYSMKLEKDPEGITSSKAALIEAIVNQTKVVAPEPIAKAQAPVFSKKKKDIKQGITYDDIFQHYNKDELLVWAKKNKLKTGGNKSELIERILAFLDGDKENTLAGTKRKAKRKRRTVAWNTREKRAAAKKAAAEKAAAEKSEEEEGDKKAVSKKPATPKASKAKGDEDNVKKGKKVESKKPEPKKVDSKSKKNADKVPETKPKSSGKDKNEVDSKPKSSGKDKMEVDTKEVKKVDQVAEADEDVDAEDAENVEADADADVDDEDVEGDNTKADDEPEGSDDDAEEALDLDDLEKYKIDVLKAYCEEEEVPVKGNKKEDYIKAILAFNDDVEEGDE